ncbi:hypothetical protein WME89_29415 [Sorangium sp. So ce321]|uniref:hypothetical protein n=1 Tax=Sorangium sp. So ce321 TaxID=3133300 RepID=UPI003F620271
MVGVDERVMQGFYLPAEKGDYSLAATLLGRVAHAVLARAKANGNDKVTCSTACDTRDLADVDRTLPCAIFYLNEDDREKAWHMSAGRVISDSSERDPENEWCICYANSGVAYVPKLITEDIVQALAERLAPFLAKVPS